MTSTTDLQNQQDIELNYYILRPDQKPIVLNLFEAERYSAAVVVQQLIGNLVFYSNHGRYEPRIAQSWHNPNPNTWTFKIKNGFVCENGEVISAKSFRTSLLKAIRIQEHKGGSLVFRKLKGFKKFIEGTADLEGLRAEGDELTFSFVSPVRDGLLESLSYAPYGYICAENFDAKDQDRWKDDSKFISSGPYKVDSFKFGKEVVLKRNESWNVAPQATTPARINFQFSLPANDVIPENSIVDIGARKPENLDPRLEQYKLVPEYLSALVLGNLESGFFANHQNRNSFKALLDKYPLPNPTEAELWTKASAIYPNQQRARQVNDSIINFTKPDKPIRIQGKAPPKNGGGSVVLRTLESALIAEKIPYEFVDGDTSMGYFMDRSFDIRAFSQSIGGEVRPWTLNVLFCSPLSYGFPDPTGNICKLVEQYDSGAIERHTVESRFFKQIEEDNLIFPMAHYGVTIFISPSIDRTSISPSMAIPRFDHIRIKK